MTTALSSFKRGGGRSALPDKVLLQRRVSDISTALRSRKMAQNRNATRLPVPWDVHTVVVSVPRTGKRSPLFCRACAFAVVFVRSHGTLQVFDFFGGGGGVYEESRGCSSAYWSSSFNSCLSFQSRCFSFATTPCDAGSL